MPQRILMLYSTSLSDGYRSQQTNTLNLFKCQHYWSPSFMGLKFILLHVSHTWFSDLFWFNINFWNYESLETFW